MKKLVRLGAPIIKSDIVIFSEQANRLVGFNACSGMK